MTYWNKNAFNRFKIKILEGYFKEVDTSYKVYYTDEGLLK